MFTPRADTAVMLGWGPAQKTPTQQKWGSELGASSLRWGRMGASSSRMAEVEQVTAKPQRCGVSPAVLASAVGVP